MMRSTKGFLVAGLLSLTFAAGSASAGQVGGDSYDIVQVTPFMGGEYTQFMIEGAMMVNNQPQHLSLNFASSGFTMGGTAGVRLGPVGLGVLVQRTEVASSPNAMMTAGAGNMDKFYGQLALSSHLRKFVLGVHMDFGYTYLGGSATDVQGLGGKFGLDLDYYPVSFLSFGAGASGDALYYSVSNADPALKIDTQALGYGGTFAGRIGLHL